MHETPREFFFDVFASYGRPGVELSASHQNETVIQELHFLPEQVSDQQKAWYFRFHVCKLLSTEGKMEGVFARVGLLNSITKGKF